MQMHCPTLALMLLQVNEQHIVKQASSCQDKQQVLFLGDSYQGEEMVAYYLREGISIVLIVMMGRMVSCQALERQ